MAEQQTTINEFFADIQKLISEVNFLSGWDQRHMELGLEDLKNKYSEKL